MSFIDTVRGIGSKVQNNGGLLNTAANFSGQKLPAGQTSSQPAWMKYTNQLNNQIMGGLAQQDRAANKQNTTPAPAQQGLPPPQQQLPGKNGYTPTTAPYGMDMSNPGVREQFWNQNQNLWTKGAFQGPGQGEQFWNQVQGNFNKASSDLTPQFNAYYDLAAKNAASSANNQAAARGVYGSSQALNGVNSAVSDVEAQRAKASTDFMFNNAANQRAALRQYGDLAFGAQGLSLARNKADQDALNSAYAAAGQAQNQRENRIQTQFNNQNTATENYLQFLQHNYDAFLGTDAGLVGAANEAKVGAASAAVANQANNRGQNNQDFGNGLALYGAISGPGTPSAGSPAQQPQYNPYSVGSSVPGYYNY